MAFHHVAIAVTDLEATDRFYREAMGFELVKVEVGPTEHPGGWAKHLFYDTGDGSMIAFWDIHDEHVPEDFDPSISRGLGLPSWSNHLAFVASSEADLEAHRTRWLDHGLDVVEIDHRWCRSIYVEDPGGTTVEFCWTLEAPDDADRTAAPGILADPAPDVPPMKLPDLHLAADHRRET